MHCADIITDILYYLTSPKYNDQIELCLFIFIMIPIVIILTFSILGGIGKHTFTYGVLYFISSMTGSTFYFGKYNANNDEIGLGVDQYSFNLLFGVAQNLP